MADLTLPPDGVLLDISPPIGEVEETLRAVGLAQEALAEHGVLVELDAPGPSPEQWAPFAERIRAATGRVYVAAHRLAPADEEQVSQVVAALGSDRVRVLSTACRMDRVLPAQWQERMEARVRASYADWLAHVCSGDPDRPGQKRFWRMHDLVRICSTWVQVVGTDRITVIASEESGEDLHRRVVGQMLDLSDETLPSAPDRAPLGAADLELLRKVNAESVVNHWSRPMYDRLVAEGLVVRMRAAGNHERVRLPELPEWALAHVREFTDRREQFLEDSRARIVGDLAKLRIADPGHAEDTFAMPDTVSISYAAFVLDGVREAAAAHLAAVRAENEQELLELKNRHENEARALQAGRRG